MTLTKEEAIRRHRMMWEWIANETLRRHECVDKLEAFAHFGWNIVQNPSLCWCCEYCGSHCHKCPIEWPGPNERFKSCTLMDVNEGTLHFFPGGLFVRWRDAARIENDWRTAAYYALYISMLPERKD